MEMVSSKIEKKKNKVSTGKEYRSKMESEKQTQ